MAQVVAPSSPFAPQHAPHGLKRSAESPLEHEQRLSKRFDLLNLVDHNGTRLYIPPLSPRARTPPPRAPDAMDVQDTPHRVYIHDLAAELSDIESDEEKPIFLPDIEKHLSKIPRHVLLGPEPQSNENNQMVLYNVPASLTVPEERDGVRKAIVEARQRIRKGQANPLVEVERVPSPRRMNVHVHVHIPPREVEAMDID